MVSWQPRVSGSADTQAPSKKAGMKGKMGGLLGGGGGAGGSAGGSGGGKAAKISKVSIVLHLASKQDREDAGHTAPLAC
jgi:hypothetical protein